MASRRQFIAAAGAASTASLMKKTPLMAADTVRKPQVTQDPALSGQIGIVSAVLYRFMSERPMAGKFTLLELPRVLRDELGLTIIDYNSVSFPNFSAGLLDKLRTATDRAGCTATNLKMNQKVDMGSADPAEREHALQVYFRSVDAAERLGLRWVRPLPRPSNANPEILVDSFHRLADYAAERGIAVLVENFGWMMDDPDSVVSLLAAIDRPGQVAAGIDTGNWSDNAVRYPALEKSMPMAVTCDFKAKGMGEDGSHAAYDLKKCFDIAWTSGFRGPWAIEHGHANRERAFREIGLVRDWLREWMNAAKTAKTGRISNSATATF